MCEGRGESRGCVRGRDRRVCEGESRGCVRGERRMCEG